MANSDLILQPKVDPQDLRKTQHEMEQAMKRAAERGEDDLKARLSKGFIDGTNTGANFMQAKIGATAVAAGNLLANAVSSAIAGAVDISFGNLSGVIGTAEQRMQEAARMTQMAENIGARPEQIAGIEAGLTAQGIDVEKFYATLGTFRESLKRDEMANYSQIAEDEGALASYLSFIRTTGRLKDPQQRAGMITDVFSRENLGFIEQFGSSLTALGDVGATVNDAVQAMLGDLSINFESVATGISDTYNQYLEAQKAEAARMISDLETGLPQGYVERAQERADKMAEVEQLYLDTYEQRYATELLKLDAERATLQAVLDTKRLIDDFNDRPPEQSGFDFALERLHEGTSREALQQSSFLTKFDTSGYQISDSANSKASRDVDRINNTIMASGANQGPKK